MIMADCSPSKYNLSGVGVGVVRGIEVGYLVGVGGDWNGAVLRQMGQTTTHVYNKTHV